MGLSSEFNCRHYTIRGGNGTSPGSPGALLTGPKASVKRQTVKSPPLSCGGLKGLGVNNGQVLQKLKKKKTATGLPLKRPAGL